MTLFNSLGSNYDFRFALRALFARSSSKYHDELCSYLEQRFGGRVTLVYKGREAIRLALRAIDMPTKYTVGICGYTCYAVYEAVVKEGYGVRYLDIGDGDLNFSLETVKRMLQVSPSMRILILQNTLGYSANIAPLLEFCRARGIIIIEDLAHSVGARYLNGAEVGTIGDFTVLSFSQDKMIDAVSGGALIIRNTKFQISNFKFQISNGIRDRFYPLLTWMIRKMYAIWLGKFLHFVFKRLHMLSMPMVQLHSRKIYGLSSWYCSLIYFSFISLDKNLAHRKKIAAIYAEHVDVSLLSAILVPQIPLSSNLRFPLFVQKRKELIAYLKEHGVFVSDIWFDSPIAPKKYLQLTDYDHECPNSEKISEMMVNLPTHENVSEQDAKMIAGKINEWAKIKEVN